MVNRRIAQPLQRLSVTADRVAHHDLTAEFEAWPSRDEVGTLAASLSSMVTSLREQTAATNRKTKELEAFTYSVHTISKARSGKSKVSPPSLKNDSPTATTRKSVITSISSVAPPYASPT